MNLNEGQCKELSKTLLDIAKLVFAVVVLGPVVSKEELSIKLAMSSIGIGFTILLIVWGLSVLKKRGD